MMTILYKLYFGASNKTFLGKEDFWGWFWMLLIRKLTPAYLKLTVPFQKIGVKKEKNGKEIIISLTSFPDRINFVWLSIETILRQEYKPNKIILWLGEEKFSGIDELPKTLKKQMNRGLSIKFRHDLKPHTKYFYAIKEFPESIIITVDDDKFYPKDMVSKLIKHYKLFPNSIICHGARLITTSDSNFTPYSNWPNWHKTHIDYGERYDLLPLGVMGVLYPPNKLCHDVLDIKLLTETSLNADDLWLKAMSLKQKTKIVLTNEYPRAFIDIPASQNTSLMSTNIGMCQNDKQCSDLNNKFNLFDLYKIINK